MSMRLNMADGNVVEFDGLDAEAFMDRLFAAGTAGPAKPKLRQAADDAFASVVETAAERQQEWIESRLRLRRPFAHRAAANGRHKSVLELLTREDDKAFVKALIRNSEWTFMLQVWKETPPPEGGSQAHTAAGKLFVRVQKALRQVGFPLQQLEVKRGLPFGRGRGAKKGTGYRLTDAGRQWLSKAQSETDVSV